MTLPDALPIDRIIVPLSADSRLDAIDALLDALSLEDSTRDVARNAVLAREDEITTGIGGGVAIPHARVEGIERPLLALGIAPQGLDYDAIDGAPVRLVFLCIAGAEQSAAHGALLASLCTFLNDVDRRERLASCTALDDAADVLGVTPASTRV